MFFIWLVSCFGKRSIKDEERVKERYIVYFLDLVIYENENFVYCIYFLFIIRWDYGWSWKNKEEVCLIIYSLF